MFIAVFMFIIVVLSTAFFNGSMKPSSYFGCKLSSTINHPVDFNFNVIHDPIMHLLVEQIER